VDEAFTGFKLIWHHLGHVFTVATFRDFHEFVDAFDGAESTNFCELWWRKPKFLLFVEMQKLIRSAPLELKRIVSLKQSEDDKSTHLELLNFISFWINRWHLIQRYQEKCSLESPWSEERWRQPAAPLMNVRYVRHDIESLAERH
jgi:hypothetical protein